MEISAKKSRRFPKKGSIPRLKDASDRRARDSSGAVPAVCAGFTRALGQAEARARPNPYQDLEHSPGNSNDALILANTAEFDGRPIHVPARVFGK
jgi:hypothetical protein